MLLPVQDRFDYGLLRTVIGLAAPCEKVLLSSAGLWAEHPGRLSLELSHHGSSWATESNALSHALVALGLQ